MFNEQNQNNDGELLAKWYKLDTNCVPPAYILQDISSIIPNFISKVNRNTILVYQENYLNILHRMLMKLNKQIKNGKK